MANAAGEPPSTSPGSSGRARKLLLLAIVLVLLALVMVLVLVDRTAPRSAEAGRSHAPSTTLPTASGPLSDMPILPAAAPYATGRGNGATSVGEADFAITGGVTNLEPGAARAIRLTLANPNDVPLTVTAVTVSVARDSMPPGCASARNVRITQSAVSPADPVAIPARGTVTLSQAPRAPQIELLDLPGVNQDACKGKSFVLTYTGRAVP